MEKYSDKVFFAKNSNKKTIVFLPALAVPSPEIYYKPFAESLMEHFNIIIVEPFGYGRSSAVKSERTVENINIELNKIINSLEIESFILAPHSISGIYTLNYSLNYTGLEGVIALDISVYDDYISPLLLEETSWMLLQAEEFNLKREAFSSNEEFIEEIIKNPEEYGLQLPEVSGYEYSEEDKEIYINAISNSLNPTIIDEIERAAENMQSIQGKQFSNSVPVLSFIAGNTVDFLPEWESAHANQLDISSDNHTLCILEGAGHYIWYTHLEQIVSYILEWEMTF
jgi:pimeloyl-ACP methyl ester carboxylesterase